TVQPYLIHPVVLDQVFTLASGISNGKHWLITKLGKDKLLFHAGYGFITKAIDISKGIDASLFIRWWTADCLGNGVVKLRFFLVFVGGLYLLYHLGKYISK